MWYQGRRFAFEIGGDITQQIHIFNYSIKIIASLFYKNNVKSYYTSDLQWVHSGYTFIYLFYYVI